MSPLMPLPFSLAGSLWKLPQTSYLLPAAATTTIILRVLGNLRVYQTNDPSIAFSSFLILYHSLLEESLLLPFLAAACCGYLKQLCACQRCGVIYSQRASECLFSCGCSCCCCCYHPVPIFAIQFIFCGDAWMDCNSVSSYMWSRSQLGASLVGRTWDGFSFGISLHL